MITFLGRVTRLREVRFAALSGALFLVSACDAFLPLLIVENATPDTVVVSFYFDNGNPITFSAVVDDELIDMTEIPPKGQMTFEIGAVEPDRIIIAASNRDNLELFRRLFRKEELEDRDWRVTITPEGIR